MSASLRCLASLTLVMASAARAEPAPTPAAYDGVWGSTAKACRDPEAVNQLGIKDGHFAWYETYCRSKSIKALSAKSWKFKLSCEGEGQKFKAKPRIVLAAPDRLIMYDAPVTPTKRQTYVRCAKSVPDAKSGKT